MSTVMGIVSCSKEEFSENAVVGCEIKGNCLCFFMHIYPQTKDRFAAGVEDRRQGEGEKIAIIFRKKRLTAYMNVSTVEGA